MTIRAMLEILDREKLRHAEAIRRIDREAKEGRSNMRFLAEERQSRVTAIRRLDLKRAAVIEAAQRAAGEKRCESTKRANRATAA